MSENLGKRLRVFLLNGKNLRTGWLITAGIVAMYIGAIRPYEGTPGIANSKATGISVDKAALWRRTRPMARLVPTHEQEIDADKFVQPMAATFLSAPPPHPPASPQMEADRKMVRTGFLDLIVQKPAETADKIRRLAESLNGFLVESQIGGGQDATSGSLTIRVPASRFEEARAEIRKLGLRVQSERIEAKDVTRQYVDEEANLRNLRAEEGQYLAILKQARTVKDTLDVSEKLGEVRGQIEQQQAEFGALSKQIETAAISISLESEAEARVFGMSWRPLYQVKVSLREGLDGLANYASTMTAAVFLLPTVLLWLATIIVVCAVGWRALRWAGRLVFAIKVAVP
jgi:hypothetical protein